MMQTEKYHSCIANNKTKKATLWDVPTLLSYFLMWESATNSIPLALSFLLYRKAKCDTDTCLLFLVFFLPAVD